MLGVPDLLLLKDGHQVVGFIPFKKGLVVRPVFVVEFIKVNRSTGYSFLEGVVHPSSEVPSVCQNGLAGTLCYLMCGFLGDLGISLLSFEESFQANLDRPAD